MRVFMFLSAVFLPVGVTLGLSAQDAAAQDVVAQDAAAKSAAAQEYEKLVKGFVEATASFRVADAKVQPLLPAKSPFHASFLAAAKRYAGTPESLPFLGWLLQNSPRNPEAHGAAVAAIEAMAKIAAAELADSGDGQAKLKTLSKKSRTAVRFLKYNVATDQVFAETLRNAKLLALASSDEQIAPAAARSVFKLERLQVGMVAPEIQGKDLDGEEFKLSDYRGKAVVIDFWGDW